MHRLEKRPRIALLGVVASLMVVVLAACGAGTVPGSGTAGGLTQEDAQAFAGFATGSVDFQLGLFADPVGLVPTGFESCTTETISGDTDGDGIPDTSTYEYDCTEAADGVDASGTIVIEDTGSGVTVTITSFTLGFPGGGSFSYDGTASVSESGGTYTSNVDLTFGFEADGESATFTVAYSQTFTPTGTTPDPFDEGTLTFSGSVSVSDGVDTYTLDAETDPELVIDAPTCGYLGTSIASGAVVFSDTVGNTLDVTYSTCTATVTYNGSPL